MYLFLIHVVICINVKYEDLFDKQICDILNVSKMSMTCLEVLSS